METGTPGAAVEPRREGVSTALARVRVPERLPWVILAAAGLASGILLVAWESHLTFLIDEWDLLLHRRGFSAGALLDPHARHLIVGPALIYKGLQATFGMESQIPYAVVATTTFLASVAVLFVYLRRRVGDWLALAAVIPVLFMGAAQEDLLHPFQMCYFGSIAFGIGALLALESRSRHGDLLTCALLLASLAFAEIALAFTVGVAIAIALDRDPLRRAWVVAVPVVLYGIWYLAWGQQGPSSLTFDHVATSPAYVLDGFATSTASLLGLGTPALLGGTAGLEIGRPLLVGLVGLAVWGLRFRPPARDWLLVAIGIGLTFWLLTAANAGLGRPPYASRYQYVGGVFILMIAAEYAAGRRPRLRPGPRAIVAALAVAVTAALSGVSMLHQSYRALAGLTPIVRGGLGGLEIAADRVNSDLLLSTYNSDFNYFAQLDAGPYLSAESKFGSPAYSPADLAGAPESGRVAADKVLAAALPVGLRRGARAAPAGPPPRPISPPPARPAAGSCLILRPASGGAPMVSLPPGGASLAVVPGGRSTLALRRFATASFPVELGMLRGAGRLVIPEDRSRRPWQLQVVSPVPVVVCGTGPR